MHLTVWGPLWIEIHSNLYQGLRKGGSNHHNWQCAQGGSANSQSAVISQMQGLELGLNSLYNFRYRGICTADLLQHTAEYIQNLN